MLRSVIYSMGVSLDGYIVGPDSVSGWAEPDSSGGWIWSSMRPTVRLQDRLLPLPRSALEAVIQVGLATPSVWMARARRYWVALPTRERSGGTLGRGSRSQQA